MLRRASLVAVDRVTAGFAAGRGLVSSISAASSQQAAGNATDRPLSGDPGVRQARHQQPSSLAEPPLLHDSLSEANYDYRSSSRASASGPRYSSISEPDYYLHNSLSEGTYRMPLVLQRTASLNPTRGQGFATAKQRPTMQRIVVMNRAVAQEPGQLHDSFSHGDYTSPYKDRT